MVMSEEDDELKRKNEEEKKALWRETSPEFRVTELIEKLSERVEVNEQESRERDEKNERNIEFIVQQQAQFTSDMQRMREAQESAEKRWERSEQRWERTEESIRALLTIAEIHDAEIKALAETQAEAQSRTDRQMAETGERLNALVNVVERIISERRNGGRDAG
jgi:hypothetical protein